MRKKSSINNPIKHLAQYTLFQITILASDQNQYFTSQ